MADVTAKLAEAAKALVAACDKSVYMNDYCGLEVSKHDAPEVNAEIERLREALAAYEQAQAATPAPAPHPDTARLDWMETQKSVSMTRLRESATPHAARYWCIEDRDGDDLTADTEPGDRQTLREAIDAARAGQGKEASNG